MNSRRRIARPQGLRLRHDVDYSRERHPVERGSTIIFAQQQFSSPKCRNGSKASFPTDPTMSALTPSATAIVTPVGGHNVPIPTKVQRSEISLKIVYVVSMINQGSSQ
jgi:hypothetical protein